MFLKNTSMDTAYLDIVDAVTILVQKVLLISYYFMYSENGKEDLKSLSVAVGEVFADLLKSAS